MHDSDLDPVNTHTPNKLQKEHGSFTQEGVRYEQSTHTNSLDKNNCAYPLTMSYEQTCNLSGPCAGTKDKQEISKHNKLWADTVAVSITTKLACLFSCSLLGCGRCCHGHSQQCTCFIEGAP